MTRLPAAAAAQLEAAGLVDSYEWPPHREAVTGLAVIAGTAAKVRTLDTYDLSTAIRVDVPDEWRVIVVPELGDLWALRWDRLTLAVGDYGDLTYVERVRGQWVTARQVLRMQVIRHVDDLGLRPRRVFLRPPLNVNAADAADERAWSRRD